MAFTAPDSDLTEEPTGFSAPESDIQPVSPVENTGFSAPDSDLSDDPTLGEIGTGLVADVALAEGLKYAGAAGGAALGSAVPVVGTAVGGTLGYVGGAITGGISGSITAQKLEGRDDISWGRVVGDTLLNFIPGSKLAKGGSVGSRILRAGGKQAAIGAAVAPAAQTVESIIEEGKIPTNEELGKMAGMGAALGFGLGGASVGLEKLLGKVGGKTVDQVDEMVATGDLTVKDLKLIDQATTAKKTSDSNTAMEESMLRELEKTAQRKSAEIAAAEIINAREIAAKGRGTLGKIFASLAPSKVVGRKSQQATIDFGRSVNEAEELGSRLARNLEKRIGGDEETNNLVNKLLDGEPVPISKAQSEKLGSSLADIRKYQEMRLELQNKMVSLLDDGAYNGLDENGRRMLQEAIKDSIGGNAYNRREYKIFLDPKYEVDPKLETAAFNELSEKMGAEKAKAHMDKLRNASAATREADPRNFSGSPVDSVLRRKHNPGSAERAWLGEVTEAPERIRGTLSGMGRSVARAEADSIIARSLVEDGIGSKTYSKGLVELVLRGTGKEGTGVYVNPEVQTALNNIYLPGTEKGSENIVINALQDLYRASVGGSKASKVLLNTIAYPVQLYGNTASLIGMGINPFNLKNATRGMDIALAEFGGIEALRKSPEGRKALLDEIQEMARYGIKNSNIIDSDLRSTLDNGIFSKAVGKVTDPLGKAYSVPDTMGRYVGWKANQNTLRKLFPDASEEVIKKEAANLINDTYQNYDKLSNVVRTLSRWGVMPQFASFTAEFARNQYNQGKVIAQMLSGKFGQNIKEEMTKQWMKEGREELFKRSKKLNKPVAQADIAKLEQDVAQKVENSTKVGSMRAEGAKRLAALTAVYGGTYGAIEGVKAASGLGQEDQDAIRDLSYADYDKNKELMVNYDKETRKGWTANPSYIIPHAIGLSALKAGMRNDDEASVIGMLSEEMIGDGSFIMQEAFRALQNKDKYGREISNEMDDLKNAQDRIKYFIAESFRPGVSREFKKFAKAKRGAGDLTLAEVGQRQLGVRKNSFDMSDAAKFTAKRNYEPAKNEASAYYSMQKYGEPSNEELQSAYNQAERINEESFKASVGNMNSMRQLGFSDDEIVQTFKDAGIPSKRILSIMDSSYQPLPMVKLPSVSEAYDNIEGTRSQKRQAIMNIMKTDRDMGVKLMNKWKRDVRSKNLSALESTFKGLDTREKVLYLKRNKGKLLDFRRKGLVNDTVMRAVRMD